MAHFHVKKKNRRPYLYVREIARVNGKPKVISQIYIGTPERTAKLVKGKEQSPIELKVEEFGSLWLARQMDKDIDLAAIVDSIIPQNDKEKGPSVGEYFLYSVFNRMVEAVSKNKMADWYKQTAIQHIRPVEINELTSQRYWDKWERVDEESLKEISQKLFERVWQLEMPNADCLLFDTTNYYTFMASDTESELARRGRSKEGRHNLRQIGLGLLVTRDTRLPIYYCIYPGNIHDSRVFESVMDEMFSIACGLDKTKERLTVVIDKGMNSKDNYAWIDEHSRIHFVTNYSPHFSEELPQIPLERFEPLNIKKNERLLEKGRQSDRMLGHRSRGEYWGKQRAVVVTYNPATARKQAYTLHSKLETLRRELLVMRQKFRDKEPHWRNPETIKERYLRLCERLHLSSDLFTVEFRESKSEISMGFRKNAYTIARKKTMFGKHIIITDNIDWTTDEIVEASLDRWQVEDRFRLSKDDDLVATRPIRHWTDSKIRCHLFTCVAALTYLRRLELRLAEAGIQRTAEDVMKDMRSFHSVIYLTERGRKLKRCLEEPTKTQSKVLSALGYYVDENGVLQTLKP